MPTSKAGLITHPVRSRIMTALMGRPLTTHQIAALLPDVPLPSLYRHVRILAENAVIVPVDEVCVNGALTKVYATNKGKTRITPEDIQEATSADHLRYFTVFLDNLATIHRASLETAAQEGSEPLAHALMTPLHLTPEEYQQFSDELSAFLKPWQENQAEGERRRIVFAHLMVLDRETPPIS